MTISQDSSAPLIVVVGATGSQGGSVIRNLADSDKPYRIRGLTRDPSKADAQNLAQQGVEMVGVNLSPENKEKVFDAFKGATYAFTMTNGRYERGQEAAEGKLLVDAAKAANVKLLIWSGLPDVIGISGGKFKTIYIFDEKEEVTRHAKAIGVPFVNVQAGGYMQNYITTSRPIKGADGTFAIYGSGTPDGPIPLIDTNSDYGLFVRKVIEHPVASGTLVHAYGDQRSHKEIAETISKVTGKKVNYVQLPSDKFRGILTGNGLPLGFATALDDMWVYATEFGYWGRSEVEPTGLARKPNTWEEFCKKTDWSEMLA